MKTAMKEAMAAGPKAASQGRPPLVSDPISRGNHYLSTLFCCKQGNAPSNAGVATCDKSDFIF